MYNILNIASLKFMEFHQPPHPKTLRTTPNNTTTSNFDSFLLKGLYGHDYHDYMEPFLPNPPAKHVNKESQKTLKQS